MYEVKSSGVTVLSSMRPPSKLDYIDSVQRSFLRHLGIDEKRAYIEFNFALLKLRRDIGMLGVLFKICRGAAHG